MSADGAPPGRFGQLTYAASDGGGGPGGWRVQDVAGGLSPAERDALTRRIVPRFAPATTLPSYPDPEQVAHLPRRLVHGPLPELGPDARAVWHSAPCGTDAYGRPGNVFTHVLLDRGGAGAGGGGGEPDHHRPADLTESGTWLRPFGTDQVATASLREVPDPPWSAHPDRSAALEQLATAPAGMLAALLDALDAALSGGPPVLLGSADMDAASRWVAAASHVMSAGTARRFHWSTYERVAEIGQWPADLHLVVVPDADLAGTLPEGLAVVHARSEPAPGARTAWSVMVAALHGAAEFLLDGMDFAADEVGDDGTLHHAWPLAMSIAVTPDKAPGAIGAAREVLENRYPPRLPAEHREPYAEVLALTGAAVGPGLDAAAGTLLAARPGPRRDLLRDLFLLRVLDDPAAPPPGAGDSAVLAGERPVAAAVRDSAVERTGRMCAALAGARSDAGRTDTAATAVRLLEMLTAVGLGAAAGGAPGRGAADLWDAVLGALLAPGCFTAVADRIGRPAGPVARDGLTHAALRLLAGTDPTWAEPGARLPAPLLGLLEVRLPRETDLVRGGVLDELERELAAVQTAADPDPRSVAWFARVWEELGSRAHPRVATALLGSARLPHPDHLALLVEHRRHPLLDQAAYRTLLGAPAGVAALASAVLAEPGAEHRPWWLAAAARLRRGSERSPSGRRALLDLGTSLLTGADPGDLASEVWRTLLTALVLEGLDHAWSPPEDGEARWPLPEPMVRGLGATATSPGAHRALVSALAEPSDLDPRALAHAALAVRLGSGPSEGGLAALLRSLLTPSAGREGVLDEAARRRWEDGALAPTDRDAAVRRLRRGSVDGWGRRRQTGEDPEPVGRTWWEHVTRPSAAPRPS